MTAEEFASTVEWTNIKSPPNQLDFVQQGVIYGEALTKGGRWIRVCAAGTILYETRTPSEALINAKHKATILLLAEHFKRVRQGVKGHRGRFTLVDFRKIG